MSQKSSELSEEVKNLIVTLKTENHKTSEMFDCFDISESTVSPVWMKIYVELKVVT
jgi:hypothetical protein